MTLRRWPWAALLACLQIGSATAAPALPCAPDRLDGGGKLDLSRLPGRIVYVDFWASWCTPCKQSFPFMNDVVQRFEAKGVTVLAVSVDSDPALARDFLKEHPARFQVALDSAGQCAKAMGVKGMPTSVILGRGGEVLHVHKGFRPDDVATLNQLLQQLSEKP